MSKKQESVSSKIKDDKEKIVAVVVASELNHGFCDIAHVELLYKKNNEVISAILQHTKNTESHAC